MPLLDQDILVGRLQGDIAVDNWEKIEDIYRNELGHTYIGDVRITYLGAGIGLSLKGEIIRGIIEIPDTTLLSPILWNEYNSPHILAKSFFTVESARMQNRIITTFVEKAYNLRHRVPINLPYQFSGILNIFGSYTITK